MSDGQKTVPKETAIEQAKPLLRRSHMEIRMDILKTIVGGVGSPTQIMYKANLSWMLLSEHLKALMDLGFVSVTTLGKRKKYTLTSRGIEIVKAYFSIVNEIESADQSRSAPLQPSPD